jgi:hypothetical protein
MHIPFLITFLWLHIRNIPTDIHKFGLIGKINKWLGGDIMKSRKLRLLIWIIALATGAAFLPPLVCWLLNLFWHTVSPLVILTDGDWITVVSITVPAYMGAITMEKHIAMRNNIAPEQLDQTVANIKARLQTNQNTQQNTQDEDTQKALENADKRNK